jgi:tetratricopeptide (TPR) repeat protein
MTRHARKPAILTLLILTGAAAIVLGATGQFRSRETSPQSMEELAKAVGRSTANADTWQAYGDVLRQNKQFAAAAQAYERALEMEPDRAAARFNRGLALGQAGDAEKFFAYVGQLTAHDPKQAVDLMDRPELAGMHGDSRWEPASVAAHGQAAD